MSFKIALCFLTYDNLSQPKIWSTFINSKYNIYIHNKNDFEGIFKKYCIKNKIETEWGKISLVKATLNLFKEAFIEKENKYFVLLSDKCIPLYTEDEIYNKILKFNNNLILSYNANRYRYNTLLDKSFFDENKFMKQNQWMILRRDTIEFFINNDYTYIFGENSEVPDEHYFINIIHKFNISFINKQVTFFNRKDTSCLSKYKKFPKTYCSITNENIEEILKSNTLFMRKIELNVNYQVILINFLLIIINILFNKNLINLSNINIL